MFDEIESKLSPKMEWMVKEKQTTENILTVNFHN